MNFIIRQYKTSNITQASLLKQSVRTDKKTTKKLENANSVKTKTEQPPSVAKTRKKTTAKEKTTNSKDGKKTADIKATNTTRKQSTDKSKTLTSSLNNNVDSEKSKSVELHQESSVDSSDVGVEEILTDSNGDASVTADDYIESDDLKDNDSDREFAVGRVGMKYREGTIGARLYEVSTLAEINGYLSLGQVSCMCTTFRHTHSGYLRRGLTCRMH